MRQQGPTLPKVLIILRGSLTNVGVISNKKTRLGDQVLVTMGQESSWHEPITFTLADGQGIKHPYKDALVISMVVEGYKVHRILIDDGSSVNILSTKTMTNIGIDASRIALVPTPLIRIERSAVPMKGAVELTVIVGTVTCCVTIQQTFMVHCCNPILARWLLI